MSGHPLDYPDGRCLVQFSMSSSLTVIHKSFPDWLLLFDSTVMPDRNEVMHGPSCGPSDEEVGATLMSTEDRCAT